MEPDGAIAMQFQEDLDAVVDKYRDQGLTLGEAVGTMVIVALNLWGDSQRRAQAEQDGPTP